MREVSEPLGDGEKVATRFPPLMTPGCGPQSQVGAWHLPYAWTVRPEPDEEMMSSPRASPSPAPSVRFQVPTYSALGPGAVGEACGAGEEEVVDAAVGVALWLSDLGLLMI